MKTEALALVPPCFCLLLGIWLVCVYAEEESTYDGPDGKNVACRKELVSTTNPHAGHITVDKWILGQGILNIATLFVLAIALCVGGGEDVAIPVGAVLICAHLAIWIWGQVEVWSASPDNCGELLYQGRIFIIMSYSMILATACLVFTGVAEVNLVPFVMWCLMLGMWIGVFVGANLPEVKKQNSWKEGNCTVTSVVGTAHPATDPNASLAARYPCCSHLCGGCEECGGEPDCGFLERSAGAFPGGAADGRRCGNGYYCCSQCCSQCCSTSCSKKSCSTSCRSCNCYCCNSVSDQCCRVECNWCYHPRYTVSIRDGDGVVVNDHGEKDKKADVCRRWGCEADNLQVMAAFLTVGGEEIKEGLSRSCYYDPDSPGDFAWSISYTASRWVLLAIPSFFLVVLPCLACNGDVCSEVVHGMLRCCGAVFMAPVNLFRAKRDAMRAQQPYTGTRPVNEGKLVYENDEEV